MSSMRDLKGDRMVASFYLMTTGLDRGEAGKVKEYYLCSNGYLWDLDKLVEDWNDDEGNIYTTTIHCYECEKKNVELTLHTIPICQSCTSEETIKKHGFQEESLPEPFFFSRNDMSSLLVDSNDH